MRRNSNKCEPRRHGEDEAHVARSAAQPGEQEAEKPDLRGKIGDRHDEPRRHERREAIERHDPAQVDCEERDAEQESRAEASPLGDLVQERQERDQENEAAPHAGHRRRGQSAGREEQEPLAPS